MSGRSKGAEAQINYLHPEKVEHYAVRLARAIPVEPVRTRFVTLAEAQLRADPRNARKLRERDLKDAPAWLDEARAQGRDVFVFAPNWRATRSLRAAATTLAEACDEALYFAAKPREGLSTKERVIAQLTRELVRKVRRMTLKDLLARATYLRRARDWRIARGDADRVLFPREEICAAPGRTWRRICSVTELAVLGHAMRNCLADTTIYHARYAIWLRNDLAHFWALYDHAGTPLMAVMVDTENSRLMEARCRGNQAAALDDLDLGVLVRARGIVIEPPRQFGSI